jgi:hypothetical protein
LTLRCDQRLVRYGSGCMRDFGRWNEIFHFSLISSHLSISYQLSDIWSWVRDKYQTVMNKVRVLSYQLPPTNYHLLHTPSGSCVKAVHKLSTSFVQLGTFIPRPGYQKFNLRINTRFVHLLPSRNPLSFPHLNSIYNSIKSVLIPTIHTAYKNYYYLCKGEL